MRNKVAKAIAKEVREDHQNFTGNLLMVQARYGMIPVTPLNNPLGRVIRATKRKYMTLNSHQRTNYNTSC